MESNSNDDYVLVLEDRTEVKNEAEVGKLSVVSDIDEKGKLKTAPAEEVQQSSFLKFNNRDGLLKNFMTNFLKQFNEPKRFGLYKVLASNVEQGVKRSTPKPRYTREQTATWDSPSTLRWLSSSAEERDCHQSRTDWLEVTRNTRTLSGEAGAKWGTRQDALVAKE